MEIYGIPDEELEYGKENEKKKNEEKKLQFNLCIIEIDNCAMESRANWRPMGQSEP